MLFQIIVGSARQFLPLWFCCLYACFRLRGLRHWRNREITPVRISVASLYELRTSTLRNWPPASSPAPKRPGPEIQQTQRRDALHPPIHDSGPVVDRVPAAATAAAAGPSPSFRGFTG